MKPNEALNKHVTEYVEDYEFRCDSDYSPNEHERTLITDAIFGLLDDGEFPKLFATTLDRPPEFPGMSGPMCHIAPPSDRPSRDANERHRQIGAALERAFKELPDGVDLHLELENGAATVRLYIADSDASIDEFDGDTFAERINAAIDQAMASDRQSTEPQ